MAQDVPAVKPSATGRRVMAVVAIVGLAVAYTLLQGAWPQIFTFATDPSASIVSRLLTAPVHLADDVMISLRSGDMVLQTGVPAFNHSDLAQAATSYLAPYVFALLQLALPTNLAVAAFAVVGLGAVAATYTLIAARARSLVNAAILVAALALTTTNTEFALNGWDHLLQGLFFAGGIYLVLGKPLTVPRLAAVSLLAAGGSLARPDGVIIAAALLWVAFIRADLPAVRRLLLLLVPFGLVTGGMLVLNYAQFGYLTPTTARLKAGAAPSLAYAKDYLFDNGVTSYSAFSLLVILTLAVIAFHRRLPLTTVIPLTAASLVTAAVAAVNSDFFPGARMFWVPTIVLATTLALTLPGVLQPGPAFTVDDSGRIVSRLRPWAQWAVTLGVVVVAVAVGAAIGLKGAVVSKEAVGGSRTAQQFIATEWIASALKPADGSVGVFYAGEAFHIPDFEVADFLGKADEAIASTAPKWGPPGHNKWDIEATLAKWNPQVILPTIDQDPNDPSSDTIAADWRANLRTHGYIADLLTSPTIRADYRYCRVPDPTGRSGQTVDVLMRKDVAEQHSDQITCSE